MDGKFLLDSLCFHPWECEDTFRAHWVVQQVLVGKDVSVEARGCETVPQVTPDRSKRSKVHLVADTIYGRLCVER
jgi:hypothetical protein